MRRLISNKGIVDTSALKKQQIQQGFTTVFFTNQLFLQVIN